MSAKRERVNLGLGRIMKLVRMTTGLWLSAWIWVASGSSAVIGEEPLRTEQGRFLTLSSDVPDADLKHYVQVFDQAVLLWQSYWQLSEAQLEQWQLQGYLMTSKQAFVRRGLLPATLPDFLNGYQRDHAIWVINQPSAYYTLHLILHEGVHGLAQHAFGGAGAPWFMEGTAEYLATHRELDSGAIEVGVIPASRQASPYWGRIGIIEAARNQQRVPSIQTVMRYGPTAHLQVEPYAWSWCAAVLMEMYPDYRSVIREATVFGRESATPFTRQIYQRLSAQWPIFSARWQLLCHDLDYGFDVERNGVELQTDWPQLEDNKRHTLQVVADRGWQAVPMRVVAGTKLTLTATGNVQLRSDPVWSSTAEGVTLTYYRGQPLARLLACVLPLASSSAQETTLNALQIEAVGAEAQFVAASDGWLLLKINDLPGELADNSGSLTVHVQR